MFAIKPRRELGTLVSHRLWKYALHTIGISNLLYPSQSGRVTNMNGFFHFKYLQIIWECLKGKYVWFFKQPAGNVRMGHAFTSKTSY